MDKIQKSHISISSANSNNNTFAYSYEKINNKYVNSRNRNKQSNNNYDIEKDLKKLMLISLKNKKYLERNDYFISDSKNKKNFKKIKLKLTPFQVYERFKKISFQKNLNIAKLNSYYNDYSSKNKNNISTRNLKNNTAYLRKLYLTSYHTNYRNRYSKAKNRARIFINSFDNNKINIFKSFESKKNINIYDSNENTPSKNINLYKINNKFKSIFKNIINNKTQNLSIDKKNKRSIGILTSPINYNKIISLKSRNNMMLGIPKLKDENEKYKIPLIYMNESKFINEIISTNK